jgi:dihydrofolate synthase / folylpolyglutamate synthase
VLEPTAGAGLHPDLVGPHQQRNAALALAALAEVGFAGKAVRQAVLATHWPARLERFEHAGATVWVDGAHNPPAAEAVLAALAAGYVLVFGAFGRKAVAETLAVLQAGAVHTVFVTPPGGLGPAADPQQLATMGLGEAAASPEAALVRAISLAGAGGVILVTGSLYLAGAMREILLRHSK